MKFTKFVFMAVGAFVVLAALGWAVITFWWLFLAVVALAVAYALTKDEPATTEQLKKENN